MAPKLKTPASESNNNTRLSYPRRLLFISRKAAIRGELRLANSLTKELKEFVERNSIHEGNCCKRCLKAHALTVAKKLGMNPESIRFIDILYTHEAGHMGYYTDGEKLMKLDNENKDREEFGCK